MEIKIVATTGKARGQAVEIRAAKFFIGRHDNCQLRPDIPGLAGIHALIEQRDLRVYLRDFGAEGGTGINDRVLHARETEVFDSDLIQIGPMVLTLSMKGKGEDRRIGLHRAPDGWPFLEGLTQDDEVIPAQVMKGPTPEPRPAADVAEPTRFESPFLPRMKPQIAPIAASLASDSAVIVEELPAEEPDPRLPPAKARPSFSRPIVGRAHAQRAIVCEDVGGVMVVKILASDLNEEETVSPVRYELRTLLEAETTSPRTVIDMGNTRYLSSRAVGVLLAHYQGLERKGASMRVCGVSKEIKPVLDQMRLSMLIDIFPTVEEAVQTPWD